LLHVLLSFIQSGNPRACVLEGFNMSNIQV
jgi:hypothetical protein